MRCADMAEISVGLIDILVLHAQVRSGQREGERDMFYLMTHLTHFIYGYMASGIW